jgi:hypothetical protein
MDQYIIDTDATILEIDGQQWFVMLNTFDYGSPELKHLASDAQWKLREHIPNFVTGMKHADGTYGFVCSDELADKIRAKLKPNHPWKKFRLYPLPDLPPKLEADWNSLWR